MPSGIIYSGPWPGDDWLTILQQALEVYVRTTIDSVWPIPARILCLDEINRSQEGRSRSPLRVVRLGQRAEGVLMPAWPSP